MSASSTERTRDSGPPLRIDWRVAVISTVIAIVVFGGLALPVQWRGGLRFATIQPQVIMWGLWLLLLPLVFAVSRLAHLVGLVSWRALAVHAVAGATLALVHGLLWSAIRHMINPPTQGLATSTANFVAFLYGGDLLRYAVLASVYHAFAYRAEAADRRVSEAKLAGELAQARLAALEAKLHPHFLFNTLNTVSALIRINPVAATSVVEHLADLLRASLYAEPGSEVTLAEELRLLEQYVAIQTARFSDRLHVSVCASSDLLGARVPQLVLQPLVENAIRHGIAPREAPGTVTVTAERRNGMLRLTVCDDGVGFGRAPRSDANGANRKGIGINNTRERLAGLYGVNYVLDLAPNAPTGTIATIELPFHTSPAP